MTVETLEEVSSLALMDERGGGGIGGDYSQTSILNMSTSSLTFSRFVCPPHNFPPQDPGKSLNRNESAGGYEVGDRAQAGEASLQPPDGNVDFGKAPSAEANPFHPSSGTAGVREGEIRVGRGRWGDRREGGGGV